MKMNKVGEIYNCFQSEKLVAKLKIISVEDGVDTEVVFSDGYFTEVGQIFYDDGIDVTKNARQASKDNIEYYFQLENKYEKLKERMLSVK